MPSAISIKERIAKMIDIDALVNALDKCYAQPETCGVSSCHYWNLRDPYCECIDRMQKDAIAILKKHQMIVQCNDCMWYWKETNQATGYCKLHDGTKCGPDFFCADGKRK